MTTRRAVCIGLVALAGVVVSWATRPAAAVRVTTQTVSTGTIARRIVATGTLAGDVPHLQVRIGLDEPDVDSVPIGEPARFEVEPYPDELFGGFVSAGRSRRSSWKRGWRTIAGLN